jgi:hypothetical protein
MKHDHKRWFHSNHLDQVEDNKKHIQPHCSLVVQARDCNDKATRTGTMTS